MRRSACEGIRGADRMEFDNQFAQEYSVLRNQNRNKYSTEYWPEHSYM